MPELFPDTQRKPPPSAAACRYMCDEEAVYTPPEDCDADGDDRARDDEATPRCTFMYDVPTFECDAGLVLCACDATLARKERLKAAGGTWRLVDLRGTRRIGWVFSRVDAERALEVLRTPIVTSASCQTRGRCA
jgi:hypothetical protein